MDEGVWGGVQVVDVLPQQRSGRGRGRGNESMVGAFFIRSGGSVFTVAGMGRWGRSAME